MLSRLWWISLQQSVLHFSFQPPVSTASACYLCCLLLFFLAVCAHFVFDSSSYPEYRALRFRAVITFSLRHLCNFLRGDYLHLCDWFLLSQRRVFWRHREVAVPITQLPRGGCDTRLRNDRWIEEKGGRGDDTAPSSCGELLPGWLIALWTVLLLPQQNMSLKVAAARCNDYVLGTNMTRKCHCRSWKCSGYGQWWIDKSIDRKSVYLSVNNRLIVLKGHWTTDVGWIMETTIF